MHALDLRAVRAIPTPVADSLLAGGCHSLGDVLATPSALKASLAGFHVNDVDQVAANMVAECRREAGDAWKSADSALQLLRRGQVRPVLDLPCRGLASVLGNSLRPGGAILEICGLPGSGKTQFCMQVCAAAQALPPQSLGADRIAEAIYVDAEGSFVPRRYAQICEAMLAERQAGAGKAGLEQMLRRMHVCRAYDATELYSTLKRLGDFLAERPKVRALVVDSLAFSFRHEFSDNTALRARVLMDIATMLRRYGAEHQLTVVVTNHMTTRFRGAGDSEVGFLVPALGETWAHQPSTQLRVERISSTSWAAGQGRGPVCRATLTKSVERVVGQQCEFQICEAGLRDVEEST